MTDLSAVEQLTAEVFHKSIDLILSCWSLYRPDRVMVRYIARPGKSDVLYVGYWNSEQVGRRSEGFSLNVIDGVCYLLEIVLYEEHRGLGHGTALYRLVEDVARYLGCRQIRQTPSGTTPRGESRKDYLLRRGWQDGGLDVYKDLVAGDC